MSLRRLGVERIDLFQLHRIDPKYPLEDQLGELAALQQEGKIRHIGLSEVTVEQLRAAQQSRHDRLRAEPVQPDDAHRRSRCWTTVEAQDIGFIPWFPLAAGPLAAPDGPLQRIAAEHGATAVAARARLAAQALTGDAADPRHVARRPSRGERGGRRDHAERRGVRRAKQRWFCRLRSRAIR